MLPNINLISPELVAVPLMLAAGALGFLIRHLMNAGTPAAPAPAAAPPYVPPAQPAAPPPAQPGIIPPAVAGLIGRTLADRARREDDRNARALLREIAEEAAPPPQTPPS